MKSISSFIIEHAIILVIASIVIGIIFNGFILKYVLPIITLFLVGMMLSAGLMIKIKQLKSIKYKQLLALIPAQYILSSAIGFILALVFFNILTEAPELALGQILHGSMPTEQTTPVWIKLSNGNLAFGIMTLIVSTLVSPFLAPSMTFIFAREWVSIDYASMLLTLIITVLLPVLIGSVLRAKVAIIERYNNIYTATSTLSALPTIMIVGALAFTFMLESLESLVFAIIASAIHFSSTIFLGFLIPKMLRWERRDIPVSVYNLSMKEFSVTLGVIASMGLSKEVGIPAAVYGMMHMALAPILARYLRKYT